MTETVHKFDLQGDAFKRDPLPTFAAMRAVGPLVQMRLPILGPMSFATTYDGVQRLLKDTDRFAVNARNAGRKKQIGFQWWMPRSLKLLAENMLGKDDPDHRRLRRLVDKAFHRQSVDAYLESIGDMADGLLDQFAASSNKDFVHHVARPLPLAVICDLLGLPQEDRPKFMRWMEGMSTVSSLLGVVRMLPAISKLTGYLRDQFEERRQRPGSDLITALVEAEEEGDQLSEDELLAMCFILFVAGHETTTHLISGGVLALLQNPGELARLKADWSRAPSAVDELLRFVSPVQMSKPRFAREDLEFQGVEVPRGTPIMALLASANSDPDAFDHPEVLDIGREKNRHMGFGGGPHLCLGLQLARAEGWILLERLFNRWPDLTLDVPERDLRWTKRMGLRALEKLPLETNG
jgi:cytochrome P450